MLCEQYIGSKSRADFAENSSSLSTIIQRLLGLDIMFDES